LILGDVSASEAAYRDMVNAAARILGDDHIEVTNLRMEMARNLRTSAPVEITRMLFEQALQDYRRAYGAADARLALPLFELGRLDFEQGAFDAAHDSLTRCISAVGEGPGGDIEDIRIAALGYLMRIHMMRGESDSAMALLQNQLARPMADRDAQLLVGDPPVYDNPYLEAEVGTLYTDLTFDIDEGGRPQRIRVTGGTAPRAFAVEASRAVRGWIYLPRIKDGKPAEQTGVRVRMEVTGTAS